MLRLLVPDMDRLLDIWSDTVATTDVGLPISPTLEPTKDGQVLRYVFWHGDARSAFTFKSLADTLNRNGFQNVRRCEFKQTQRVPRDRRPR